jgi:prophage regulatory protein
MDIEEPKFPTILRAPAVKKRVGLSYSTIWRQEKKGAFPRRIRLSDNAVGWLEEDIQNWLANRPRGMAAARCVEGQS